VIHTTIKAKSVMFRPVFLARRVLELERRQHSLKVCSLHTPEARASARAKRTRVRDQEKRVARDANLSL